MNQDPGISESLPLEGKTIVVTRSIDQAPNLSNGLEKLGASIVEFPTININLVVADMPPAMGHVDWIVFTSANAVRGLHSSARAESLPLKYPKVKVCCVGPATEIAAQEAGLSVDLLPDIYTSGDVFAALHEAEGDLKGKRILLPRGNIANPKLRDELLGAGAEVVTLIVYETECPPRDEEKNAALLAAKPDMVTFTSASTAKNFVALLGKDNLEAITARTAFASIGPETTKAALSNGMEIYVEPEQHDIPGLTRAIATYYS